MTADECEFFSQDYCCPPDYIVKAGFVCGVFMKRCGNCARNTGHTYCHQMLKVQPLTLWHRVVVLVFGCKFWWTR